MTTKFKRRDFTSVVLGMLVLMGMLLAPSTPALAATTGGKKADTKDGCVNCHSDRKFLVQNPKLFDYYQNWKLSVHGQEDITCVACHGGDPKATNAAKAHGSASLAASSVRSAINFRNIPETCAKCHEEIYNEYRDSPHFQHLVGEKGEPQGPNCVTCHGSVNTAVLRVSTVRETCVKCHNEETGNSPEIPGEAEKVLSKMLSVSRYYHFIAVRGEPEDVRSFFRVVDPLKKKLGTVWHSFDIEAAEKETSDLLKVLKLKRQDIQKANAKKDQ